jgi:hypothetical protein
MILIGVNAGNNFLKILKDRKSTKKKESDNPVLFKVSQHHDKIH